MNSVIRILVSGMSGNYGGVESLTMNYIRNVNTGKIQFDFLCYGRKIAYDNEIIDRGGKIHYLPRMRKYVSYYKKIISIFHENKYDGFWSNRCDLAIESMLVFKIAYRYGVPLRILHAHSTGNIRPLRNNRIFHEINKIRIEKYVTDFWACSQEAGNFFYREKIINSPKYKIIKNAIDLQSFKFDFTTRHRVREKINLNDKFIIGHVGSFLPVKNHVFLLRVFHEIRKKEATAVLLLIGDGKLRPKIESITEKLNLTEVVHFLGLRSDIPELLNAMDVFILPSKFEGLPISLIEAQSASLYSFVSTKVSSKTKITECLSFVDLRNSPAEWAELILTKKNCRRVDMMEEVCKAGYDIKIESVKFEQFLLNSVGYIG